MYYLKFVEVPNPNPKAKTKGWRIVTATEKEEQLGVIYWYSAWRCYVFAPGQHTIFEKDCLAQITSFIDQRTREQRVKAKAVREARK